MEDFGSADPWRLLDALAGDRAAWLTLVDEFGETIWQWARRAGLEREDAEDVCQSVWYLLKDRGRTIEDPRRLPGWLATTTRHEALAAARRRTRRALNEAPLSAPSAQQLAARGAGPDDHVISGEMGRELAKSFQMLSAKCRDLLPLLWSKSVSYAEIAELLDMAVGSIGPTKRRCLDALRAGVQA